MSSLHHNRQIINQLYKRQQSQMILLQSGNFKPFTYPKCIQHHLLRQFTCLQKSCACYNSLICLDCDRKCSHRLLKLNNIIPSLCEWLKRQNSFIQEQNKNLQIHWKIISTNIQYCINILSQLLQIIGDHTDNRLYLSKNLIDITGIVYGMFTHDSNNQSIQMLLRSFNQLEAKYQLFDGQKNKKEKYNISKNIDNPKQNIMVFNWQQIFCNALEKQKQQKIKQALSAISKSKQFSEKALAFSETLSQLIQSKVKEQQTKIKLKQIAFNNQISLKDLLTYNNTNNSIQLPHQSHKLIMEESAFIDQIKSFSIQLPTSKKSLSMLSDENISQSLTNLSRMSNLKQLKINNKNGKLTHKIWYHILNYVQMLKFLKQLRLVLTEKDLQNLTKLFKQKQKSVRQIQSITLTITDEKQLELTQVNQFLQNLQLRRLNLILSRNNLSKKQIADFLKKLRIYTSLSQLPLIECNINFTKNNVHSDEQHQLHTIFQQKCKEIKIKGLTL